ncbi:MAG: 4-hydroxy-3-methylbut-2-en-1-yl diphosphate synthase, partial [Pseudolabrys sp.]
MSTTPPMRHKTVAVQVGGVAVGGGAPIVQSMTNTDTAGITVDRDEAAAAVPRIKERLLK